jgi:hypothetical protein
MKTLLVLVALLFAAPVHARDPAQVTAFKAKHACPATHKIQKTCPGYVVDHIIALDCGGKDAPSNMQWQTVAAGKAKDKVERNGPTCKHRTVGKP